MGENEGKKTRQEVLAKQELHSTTSPLPISWLRLNPSTVELFFNMLLDQSTPTCSLFLFSSWLLRIFAKVFQETQ